MRLIIIGTSHISPESVAEIRQAITTHKPEAVAIELDHDRLRALFEKSSKRDYRMIKKVGLKGFLFAAIGSYIQEKLGKHIGMEPGDDMRAAVKTAREAKIPLLLIDQHIGVTLQRISKEFTWKEKGRLVGDVFRALFFGKRELKKRGLDHFDLKKVPQKKIIKQLTEELRQRYPSLYKVLIEERNQYMARQLHALSKQYQGVVLAVIGAGHEEGIVELLRVQTKNIK